MGYRDTVPKSPSRYGTGPELPDFSFNQIVENPKRVWYRFYGLSGRPDGRAPGGAQGTPGPAELEPTFQTSFKLKT